MTTVTIQDETGTGRVLNSFQLELLGEQVTVRELIMARVTEEVSRYNRSAENGHYNGLVQPSETELRLNNTPQTKAKRLIDAEKQCYVALAAFQQNGFFVLVDDRQVDDLEQRLTVTPTTTVSFIKLTPLVGG